MKYCSECGTELIEGAQYCPNCGHKLYPDTPVANTNPKASAARTCGILSIVFGALGGVAGLVLGIINLNLSKYDKHYQKLGIIGISLFTMWMIILIVLLATNNF